MASQVLSGSGFVSYTNNTGQNVRVVINYMYAPTSMSWKTGVSVGFVPNVLAIGRNLAFSAGAVLQGTSSAGVSLAISSNNMVMIDQSSTGNIGSELTNTALPTEIMLAPGDIFSAGCGSYNIVVIPEAG